MPEIEITTPTFHPGQVAAYRVKDPETGKRHSLGCYCVTDFKNLFRSANCWARDRDADYGWSDRIRGCNLPPA